MVKYSEKNLVKDEQIIKTAEKNVVALFWKWFFGILFCWVLLIPTILAIIATIRFLHLELTITNKRIVGKYGVINTKAMDAPVDKIQDVTVSHGLLGKIFNYGTIDIETASNYYSFEFIKNVDAFKNQITSAMDIAAEERSKKQAAEMAQAMAEAMKQNKN